MKAHKLLPALPPNRGTQAWYKAKLLSLIDDMSASVEYWLLTSYRKHPPALMAQDATSAAELQDTMKGLRKQWERRFSQASKDLASYFTVKVQDRVDGQLEKHLADAGFAVGFALTPEMRDVLAATINENVALIKSIPAQYLTEVEGMVMRSVATGGDLQALVKELRDRYGITKRRAVLISRDQNSKALATILRVRQQGLELTEAVWLHSHAGKVPRPEHVGWNGSAYKIAEGKWSEVDGAYVWPGTAINCRCMSRTIVPSIWKGKLRKAA